MDEDGTQRVGKHSNLTEKMRKTNVGTVGITKKRGGTFDWAGPCESRASNKFGHGKEMELFRIDNAVG